MKILTTILAVAALTAGTASAHGVRTSSPSRATGSQTIVLRGRITSYIPARGLTNGSVTVRVSYSNMPALADYGSLVTARVTPSTVVSGPTYAGSFGTVTITFVNVPFSLQGLAASRIDTAGSPFLPQPLLPQPTYR